MLNVYYLFYFIVYKNKLARENVFEGLKNSLVDLLCPLVVRPGCTFCPSSVQSPDMVTPKIL